MTAHAARQGERRRNAAATRDALLDAARTLLASRGVEGTSTRDVASIAGVSQALVYRYFGSKEKLFSEAAHRGFDPQDTLIADTALIDLPRALLERALMAGEGGGAGRLADLIAASNDTTVRAVIREQITRGFDDQLAGRLHGEHRRLRAELLAALVLGVAVLRAKVGTPALSDTDFDVLADHIDRIATVLLR